jgi:acyl transferase domain-containing protein
VRTLLAEFGEVDDALGQNLFKLMREGPEDDLKLTENAQPAIMANELAVFRVLTQDGGVSLDRAAHSVAGHSLGEYVAACLAGVFKRDDALVLLARRARMMQNLPGGAMLAALAPLASIEEHLTPETSVAAVNAPNVTVIAGDFDAIASLEARLAPRGIESRRLPTSHAFHSSMIEPIVEEFSAVVASVPRAKPAQQWIASLTGERISDDQATDPHYWAQQMRHTVRFMDGVGKLMDPSLALLEVGPGQALTNLARQHPARNANQLMVASLHGAQDPELDHDALYAAAGRLWTAGFSMDWHAFHADAPRRKVSLPTYPFERVRHWTTSSATAEF